ncbi:GntR family transcriptional regulator [Neobacillus niacini]|jgi:GntR family transcriptional regulator|uniref:GntR family transcriptional regulator n=1 Tax=Neobacillus niacini TaxID=86668 RepID=UPI001C8D391F|nr:GntR family transcriptional regulator [Neobacillus niacini]MBY0146421.1 GntR family transcriptional regulator [Neobacillus niacini]
MDNNQLKPREEVVEKIEYYIDKNQLRPHDKLPSERQLCEVLGTSRTTLRSAIKRLIMEGVVYSKRGAGTFVAPQKLVRNLQDMESLSKSAEEANKVLSTKVLFADIIECNKELSKRMKLTLGSKIYCLQRLRLIDGIPSMMELAYIDYSLCNGIEQYDFSNESLYRILGDVYNVKIDHGSESLSVTYVSEQESELLDVESGTPVFYIRGNVYTEDEKMVEFYKSIVRADQIRFSSVLKHYH